MARKKTNIDYDRSARECEDGESAERPNPCREIDEEAGCECAKTPTTRTPGPARPPRPKPRQDECCERLIELLACDGERSIPRPHKPKARPGRKVRALCDTLGIADRILPVLDLLWERQANGEEGRNDFEKAVQGVFAGLDSDKKHALQRGFDGYRALRKSGKGECLFDDCLADAGRKGAIERSWFAEELLREGLKLAGQTVFPRSNGEIGPGQVRLWDNVTVKGPNGSATTIYQGPWPWLTAIMPAMSSDQEFGNIKSFRPAPNMPHQWENYQYDQICAFKPDPSGKIVGECKRKTPPPPPPPAPGQTPQFGPTEYCEGGPDYTSGGECLKIPEMMPGASFKLRGFNWITDTVTVRFTSQSDPNFTFTVVANVWGDQMTPAKDTAGHAIVDETVFDCVDVSLPDRDPRNRLNLLPSGLYRVSVEVVNVTNAIFDGATPPTLITNELLLKVSPDPDRKYQFWSQRGRCHRETPGWGDDEIWWDAYVGHLIVTDVAQQPGEPTPIELRPLDKREFPRDPWSDMDSGEDAGAYKIDIFGPKSFERSGVAAISIVGFEVDSESAARDQLQGFANAYWEALKSIYQIALAGEGLASYISILAKATLSQAIAALAIIAAIVLVALVFWASWAPADLIALDLIALDATSAWTMTDPGVPLPAPTWRFFADETGRESIAATGSRLVTITETPRPKLHKPNDKDAVWIQENQYDTPEESEDSSYMLEFRLGRN